MMTTRALLSGAVLGAVPGALFLTALALTGLSMGPAPAAAQGGNLVLQVPTEPPGLDLTASPASAIGAVVHYNVQECLVKVDRTGRLVPWLAERWYTTDNVNYTFFLRKGVRFHNGREFKAADVKYVLERAANPETKHPQQARYAAIADMIVKDDYTITLRLNEIDANFLLTLARQGSVIYPREAVETLKSQPVGTGPFALAEWIRGDRIMLARNREYHVKGVPHLDRVTYRFIPDPNAALAALKAGDVDASFFGIGPEHVDDLRKDNRFQVVLGDTTNDVILAMNNAKKPFSDRRVRLAVTHAINKDEVLKGAMFGYGKVLGSNVDPLNPYYVDMTRAVPYDAAKAKKLLADAGYPNGFDAVLRVAPQYYYTVRTGEILVNQLAKVGVRVKIEQIEWGQWLSQVFRDANYDLSIIGHAEPWDINNYANPKYYYRWDSPEFQKLFKESEVALDDKKRRELYARLQKMLAEEAPAVWLYMHPRLAVSKKGLTGFWKDLPISAADLSEVAWQK
jgi:peptide/nickel transport system substrate-binding protein